MHKYLAIISCVDAGSAKFLLPVIPLLKFEKLIFSSGSATKIFDSAGINHENIDTSDWIGLQNVAENILKKKRPNIVICGTSWSLSLDKALIVCARKLGILTLSTVDHWRLVEERYVHSSLSSGNNDLTFISDYVIVIDKKVKSLLENAGVNADRILLGGNPHLEHIEDTYLSLSEPDSHSDDDAKDVLFVSEIVRDDLPEYSYDEYIVLRDLSKLTNSQGFTMEIKLHPNEKLSKFSTLVSDSIIVKRDIDFLQMILKYKFIVGMDSMLLFELGICRTGVISYRPNLVGENRTLFDESSVICIYDYDGLKNLLKNTNEEKPQYTKTYSGSSNLVAQHIYNLLELG